MTEEEIKQRIRDVNTLINTCFIMADAIDVMNRKAEKMALTIDGYFTHHGKFLFSNLKSKMLELRVTMEHFNNHCMKELGWEKYDVLREDSNDLIRLILYYADRTYHDDMKVRQIENFVRFMPENNTVSDYLIKQFKLR